MTLQLLARKIDHTQLKPYSTITDIEKLCHEAMEFQFACACINGCWAPLCRDILKGTDIKVGVAVGFPLGAMATDVKVCEAKTAILQGSNEIDMVINIGYLKDKKYKDVELDIKKVKEVCKHIELKVILETCLLTDEEKRIACEIAVQAGATFVKTSTGFSTGGATIHDIELMKKTVGPTIGVKASGGIHTYQTALEMLNAGASRIGTISSVSIMEEAKKFLA